eukprot:TRINITY_DN4256_c0_g1_i2.p1 TRINITY_DN4256_c0_g1~~TRINITY_DN4256_c0_g1_i2.p1  ORF type:complete len:568 (+),score=146.63 TRINITY_DN4256_c0_g1_i2:86-1789(+)
MFPSLFEIERFECTPRRGFHSQKLIKRTRIRQHLQSAKSWQISEHQKSNDELWKPENSIKFDSHKLRKRRSVPPSQHRLPSLDTPKFGQTRSKSGFTSYEKEKRITPSSKSDKGGFTFDEKKTNGPNNIANTKLKSSSDTHDFLNSLNVSAAMESLSFFNNAPTSPILNESSITTYSRDEGIRFVSDSPTRSKNRPDISNRVPDSPSKLSQIPKTLIPESDHIIEKLPFSDITDSSNADLPIKPEKGGININQWPRDVPSCKRHDVIMLEQWIQKQFDRIAASGAASEVLINDLQRLYFISFHELTRQVSVQCNERGQLLQRLWLEHNGLFERVLERVMLECEALNKMSRKMQEQIHDLFSGKTAISDQMMDVSLENVRLRREIQTLNTKLIEHNLAPLEALNEKPLDHHLQGAELELEKNKSYAKARRIYEKAAAEHQQEVLEAKAKKAAKKRELSGAQNSSKPNPKLRRGSLLNCTPTAKNTSVFGVESIEAVEALVENDVLEGNGSLGKIVGQIDEERDALEDQNDSERTLADVILRSNAPVLTEVKIPHNATDLEAENIELKV